MLWDNCPVTEIIPGDSVKLVTSKGDVMAKRVVLTVGPWAPIWAKTLGIQFQMRVINSLYCLCTIYSRVNKCIWIIST